MDWALPAVFMLAVAISLAELAGLIAVEASAGTFAGREAALVHAPMNGAMAVMALPIYTHALHRAAIVAFVVMLALAIARFAWLVIRAAPPGRAARLAGAGYHACGIAAMVYALWRMPMMGPICGGGASPGALAWVLAAVFMFDAMATAILAGLRPRLALGPPAAAAVSFEPADMRAVRILVFPHVVMDLGMAAMLVFPAAVMA